MSDMSFKIFLLEVDLSNLLAPPSMVPQIGHEKAVFKTEDGVCKYTSREGSHRYVYKVDGQAVSVLQVVSREKGKAVIANIYTLPEFRRHKFATKLFSYAKTEFPTIDIPTQLSSLGQLWRNGLEDR